MGRLLAATFAMVFVSMSLLSACADAPGGPTVTNQTVSPADGSPATSVTSTASTVSPIPKTVATDGTVALGDLATDGFTLAFPADAYAGVADVTATWEPGGSTPAMENATVLGDGYAVDTGGTGRLETSATLTYHYEPAVTPDPMLLALAYHDGSAWTYIPAADVDTRASAVTFSIFHFSAYYPAQFKTELEAAKHYAAQMAAQKVLGEGGGDPQAASAALADLLATKLGLGEDAFSKEMLADIASDQDVLKVFDEAQADGWTDTGYEYVMHTVCGKISQRLIQNKEALGAEDVTGLSNTEAAFKRMGDVLRVGKYSSKFLGSLLDGDTDAAARELFDLATDYTGLPGKALKYTLQGMQNAVDVWREGEVEKAFKVYLKGSTGSLFGYGAVDAGDFDGVWENMKGASRQLCAERIAAENAAREMAGMPPLSAAEEDFYREKVKQELKREFDRRIALADKIEAQRKNLDLIFTELDAAKMFDGTNVWIRSLNDPNETLVSRLNRFNRLIGRIFSDLKIETVYSGPQQEGELKGRISATAMAEMLRGYFSANTQAEGEAFLQEYYKRWKTENLAGDWSWTGAQETNGKLGPSSKAYTYTFREEGSGWALYYKDTRLCPVSFDGKNVSFTVQLMGSATFTGVLNGDTITGTQSHDGGKWEGVWNAARVR